MAIRLPWSSQWPISAVWTDFQSPRSTVPSSLVAAVTKSGTITMVTSSAMARPLIPVRAVSEPENFFPLTGAGEAIGLLQREDSGLEHVDDVGEVYALLQVDLDLDLGGGPVHFRLDVGVTRGDGDPVETFDFSVTVEDDEVERRGSLGVVIIVLDLLDRHRDIDVRLHALDGQRVAEGPVCGRQRQLGRLTSRCRVGDTDDIGDGSAVLEVAVNGDRQQVTVLEAAVEVLKVSPAGDQSGLSPLGIRRVILRALRGEPHEGGDRRGGGRQALLRRRHLFDVDAWRSVSGHGFPSAL